MKHELFHYIKANNFLAKYCPQIKSREKKIHGKNSNGNDIDFTPAEKAQINKALEKMVKENKLK